MTYNLAIIVFKLTNLARFASFFRRKNIEKMSHHNKNLVHGRTESFNEVSSKLWPFGALHAGKNSPQFAIYRPIS